jgi:hypothetical protein
MIYEFQTRIDDVTGSKASIVFKVIETAYAQGHSKGD